MEQCIKCNKEFKIKDLFLQWYTNGEAYVCKDCIEKHKIYQTEACYSADSDITFVFAIARVQITKHDWVELSQILIGYHYGSPDNSVSKEFEQRILEDWLTKNGKVRKDLLRQAFNENCKSDEEVLY